MSNSNNDMDRYFNDRDYRRQKATTENDRPSRFDRYQDWYNSLSKGVKYALFIILFLLFTGIVFFIYLYQGLPSIKQLDNPQTAVASRVVSREGVVLDKFYTENRTDVPLDKISPHVVNALIATEDHRFYHHWGIDMVRTLAIPYHLLQGEVEGGSTITQQLARNLYKQIGRKFSVVRKLREMITAVDIEQHYTKREIIDMYLNTVEFSNSSFGIESAAETHFGKPAKDLNLSEAATLIGSVNAPYAYNPRLFPERSMHRRNVVLLLMNKRGFISDTTFKSLRRDSIGLDYHPPSQSKTKSRYFGQYVRQKIQHWVKKNGYDLNTDGLVIHTTIDAQMQQHAQQALEEKLDSLQVIFQHVWTSPHGKYMDRLWGKYPRFLKSFLRETDQYKNGFSKYHTKKESVVFDSLMSNKAFIDSVKKRRTKLEAGFVAIDPANGQIRAWIGGSNYGRKQYDHVYQSRRQVGSTFKPFVYTVAVDNGIMPYQKFSNSTHTFYQENGKIWSIKNFESQEGKDDMVPLRKGLAKSLNNVTVDLLPALAGNPNTHQLEDLKPAARKIKQMASNFGIDMSDTPAYPSIALGTAETSLLQLASAYTTFANQGVHVNPIAITRIDDKQGHIVKQYHSNSGQEVISAETAYIMVDMLRGVIRGGKNWYGTGIRLQSKYHVQQDIAGKTGTTQNAADNWFMAMTPHLVMGAWVGGDDRRIRFPTWSRTGQGAHTALPIVGRFINLCAADPQTNWSKDSFKSPPGFVMPTPPKEQQWQNDPRIDW